MSRWRSAPRRPCGNASRALERVVDLGASGCCDRPRYGVELGEPAAERFLADESVPGLLMHASRPPPRRRPHSWLRVDVAFHQHLDVDRRVESEVVSPDRAIHGLGRDAKAPAGRDAVDRTVWERHPEHGPRISGERQEVAPSCRGSQ